MYNPNVEHPDEGGMTRWIVPLQIGAGLLRLRAGPMAGHWFRCTEIPVALIQMRLLQEVTWSPAAYAGSAYEANDMLSGRARCSLAD